MSHYQKGLKPEVRLELDRNCTWEDLNELIEESIKADEMLYEYQKERRSSNVHGNRDRGVNYDIIKDIIKTEYSTDAIAKRILAIPDNPERGFTIEDGFIHFHGKLYISFNLVKDYVMEQYELPAYRHQGIARTFARIRREVYFPKMRTIVENIIGNYNTCIRNKAAY
ncbi:hypothetical protein SS1G_00407 [Sclerotinia sclerotiorum 1980 UF-70]|uniref:Integrase zinc-binding domain-containing protein n=1 Tax=Sclerotinia sclerotiorum (strain ATCC 18683 / 1980 / Ss-1) TaxID=665079 RepID=A7E535_SCLS1|nr:hypothetical protein SS1G_00407 [Sclerotinia sclerotiorum 1980 UF-70]EDN91007.1 hypothetical protein SS1G_00407 [Sclerotinia sclerotiorum 1980 UF-70]